MRSTVGLSIAVHHCAIHCLRKRCGPTQATIGIGSLFKNIDYSYTSSRVHHEELDMGYFRKPLVSVEKYSRDSGLDVRNAQEVVHDGRPKWVSKIQAMIQEYFEGKEQCNSITANENRALGAAMQAAIRTGEGSLQVQDLLPIGVTGLSGNRRKDDGTPTRLIERDATIPQKEV
jgi:heat shock protein 1/8